jgi:RNA polymerase sigma-70 factor (ECF subfamily)
MLAKRRFAKLYNQYADDIYRFLFVHVRDVELAEDLTADTFLKAWKQIETFDWRHSRGWLYAIARNTMTDHWRKHKPLPLDEDLEVVDENQVSQAEALDKKLEFKRAAKAITKLPEDMKSVVLLRFMQGYSVRQTAEALDMSEANVRVTQYRALKKLRGALS